MTPREFAGYFQAKWESSKVSLDKADNGNFFKGELVGSKYGVTGAALARHRKVASVTAADMAALGAIEAADIFLADYYFGPNFHLLPWCRPVASMVDFGYGTGPEQAIKCAQRMVDAPLVDGIITPGGQTAKRIQALIASEGEVFVAGAWWTIRDTFYELVIEKNAAKAKYEGGWDNRSRDYTPSSSWWNLW
jgi:lysozyme family protein